METLLRYKDRQSHPYFQLNFQIGGQWDSSGVYCQARHSEFDPWKLQGLENHPPHAVPFLSVHQIKIQWNLKNYFEKLMKVISDHFKQTLRDDCFCDTWHLSCGFWLIYVSSTFAGWTSHYVWCGSWQRTMTQTPPLITSQSVLFSSQNRESQSLNGNTKERDFSFWK